MWQGAGVPPGIKKGASDFIHFSKSAVSALFGKKNAGADTKFTTNDSITDWQRMRGRAR